MKKSWIFALLLTLCCLVGARTPQMTVARSFSVDKYEPGQQVTVTISLTEMDFVMTNGSLTEFLPPGWRFIKKQGFQIPFDPAIFDTENGGTSVNFTFVGGWALNEDEDLVYTCPQTFKYIVQAPDDGNGDVSWSGYFNVATSQFTDGTPYKAETDLGDNIVIGGATSLAGPAAPVTTHNVVFHGNGGFSNGNADVTVNDVAAGTVSLASFNVSFIRDDYDFIGWSLAANDAENLVDEITVPQTTEVYAQWTLKPIPKYSVVFHGNGGLSGGDTDVTVGDVTAGTVTLDSFNVSFIRDGYDFTGWSLAADDKDNLVNEITVPDTLEVYAQWSEKPVQTYTVVFHGNGGMSGTKSEIQIEGIPAGDYSLSQAGVEFSYDGHTFIGWGLQATATTTVTTITVPEVLDVYAQWEEIPAATVKVTYHSNHVYGILYPSFYEMTEIVDEETSFIVPNYSSPFVSTGMFPFLLWATPISWNTANDGTGVSYAPGDTLETTEESIDLYIIWQGHAELEVFPLNIDRYFTIEDGEELVDYLYNSEYLMLSTDGETSAVSFTTDDMIQAHFNVGNWGLVASGEFKVAVRITDQNTSQITTVTKTVDSFEGAADPWGINANDQIAQVSVEIGKLPEGTYAVDYIIDPDNDVYELQKDNNEMSYYKGEGYAVTITVNKAQADTYSVVFHGNGGFYGNDTDVTVGDVAAGTYSLSSFNVSFTRDNYDFLGWSLAVDDTDNLVNEITVPETTEVYAQWVEKITPATYTVVFHGNGGVSDTQSEIHVSDVPAGEYDLSKAEVLFLYTGHVFKGWALQADATETVTSITVPDVLDVYALWDDETTPTTVQVTYHSNHLYGLLYPDYYELLEIVDESSSFIVPDYSAPFAANFMFDLLNWATPVAWNTASDGSGTNYVSGDTIVAESDRIDLYIIWDEHAELEIFPLDISGYIDVWQYGSVDELMDFYINSEYLMLSTDGITAKTEFSTDDTILARLNVGNYGLVASGEFKVDVRITDMSTSQMTSVTKTVNSISGAADPFGINSMSQIAQVTVDLGQLPIGTYAIDYVVDPDNDVYEIQEDNNELSYYKGVGYAVIITVATASYSYSVNYCDNVTSYGYGDEDEVLKAMSDQTEIISLRQVFGRDIFSLKFVSWNEKRDGTGEAYYPGDAITKNLTLYAQYRREPQLWFWTLIQDESGDYPMEEDSILLTVSTSNDDVTMAEKITSEQEIFANFNIVNYFGGDGADITVPFMVSVLVFDESGAQVVDSSVAYDTGMPGNSISLKHGISLGKLPAGRYTLECMTDSENTVAEATERDSYQFVQENMYFYKKVTLAFDVQEKEGYDEWPDDMGLYSPTEGKLLREKNMPGIFRWPSIRNATQYKLAVWGYDGTMLTDVVVDNTSYTIDGLKAGSYMWNVTALDGNGKVLPAGKCNELHFAVIESNGFPVITSAVAVDRSIRLTYDTTEEGYADGMYEYQIFFFSLKTRTWTTLIQRLSITAGQAVIELNTPAADGYLYISPVTIPESNFVELYIK